MPRAVTRTVSPECRVFLQGLKPQERLALEAFIGRPQWYITSACLGQAVPWRCAEQFEWCVNHREALTLPEGCPMRKP